MNIENTPALVTERLILRKFTQADTPALFEILADQEANRFLPWFVPQTLAQAEEFLQTRFLAYYRLPQAYRYAVCRKEDDRPIGYLWLDGGESHDFGYGLKKEWWHQGLATEAARAAIEKIRAAGLPYITATHDVDNPRSGEVMKKLGMTYRYSYLEQWQPKNISVAFRLYQLDFDGGRAGSYPGYWNRSARRFIEPLK